MAHMSRNQKYTDATGVRFEQASGRESGPRALEDQCFAWSGKVLQAPTAYTYGASYRASVYEHRPCGINDVRKAISGPSYITDLKGSSLFLGDSIWRLNVS